MVDQCVDLITISENNELVLNNSVLENLFQNIKCPFAILTIINDSENFDPNLLDWILCYFVNNGKLDWSNELTSYKWNSDPSQEITCGIKVWPRPLHLFYSNGHKNEFQYINVILMENNLIKNVSEEIRYKLIALSIDISSNILFNTNESLIRSSLISLEQSLKYAIHTEGNKFLFMFLVRDWKKKKYEHGFQGGKYYYQNILYDSMFNNIDKKLEKYFREKTCFLMPGYERNLSTQYRIVSTCYSSLGILSYFNKIIETYLESDKISLINSNAFEYTEKIKMCIKYPESCRDSGQTSKENQDAIQDSSYERIPENKSIESGNFQISPTETNRYNQFPDASHSMTVKNSISNKSKLKSSSNINKLESYIKQRSMECIFIYQPSINRENLLNFNYFDEIHNNLVVEELKKLEEFSKSLFSDGRYEELLVKNLVSKYEELKSCQHVVIQFWNFVNQEFKRLLYFENKYIRNLLDELRERYILEINSKLEKVILESIYKVFDEICSFYITLNNDVINNEKIIAEKNSQILRDKYYQKLMEEITNDSFDELATLKKYNNALIIVCLKSLNAGLEFKDSTLKISSEDYLKTILNKAFKTIESYFRNKSREKINKISQAIKCPNLNSNSVELDQSSLYLEFTNSCDFVENEITLKANSGEHASSQNQIESGSPIEAVDFGPYLVRYGYFMNNQSEVSQLFSHCEAFSGKDTIIGEDAEKLAGIQSENVIIHLKLFLGSPAIDSFKNELQSPEISEFEGMFVQLLVDFDSKRTSLKCEKIIGLVLKRVKKDAELLIGSLLSNCVISIPKSFSAEQQEEVTIAAAIAGLKVKIIKSDTMCLNWLNPPYIFLIKSE